MKLVRMTDAAFPPRGEQKPRGSQIVAGYIGGNTPHVWTEREWASFGRMRKLPIFVRDSRGDGHADGLEAVAQLARLNVPRGTTVAYDLETLVYGAMVTAFYNVLRARGFYVWVYGSADFVLGNPPCSGYWVADYDNQPEMYPGKHVVAKQYAPNVEGWDWSEVKGWQVTHRIKAW